MRFIQFLLALAVTAAASGCGNESETIGSSGSAVLPQNAELQANMVGAWATAPYGPYPLGPLTQEGVPLPGSPELAFFPNNEAGNQSFRMIIHPSIGGSAVRVRLSNLVGDRPIRFENISIAKGNPLTPLIQEDTLTPLTVGGRNFALVQPGEELLTDIVPFEYQAQEDLAVSFYVPEATGPMTWHAVSFAPQYISLPNSGDVSQDPTGARFNQISLGWFFLSGLDVFNEEADGAVVAIGDSITDGAYQLLNQRWPDFLAQRLLGAGYQIGVLNQGINSNTVTRVRDGFAGPPLVDRFERDVIGRSGVKSVIILEGTNDLGAGVKAPEIIAGLEEVIAKARLADLCVYAATLLPRADLAFGWFPDGPTIKEPERVKVNEWIRTTALIDGFFDFEKAMALPGVSSLPNPALYTPDLLHPNSAGFLLMANEIDLDQLAGGCSL